MCLTPSQGVLDQEPEVGSRDTQSPYKTEIDKGAQEKHIDDMHFTSAAGWPGAHGAREWSSGAPSERQEKSPPGSDLSRPIHEISLNSRVLRNGEPKLI